MIGGRLEAAGSHARLGSGRIHRGRGRRIGRVVSVSHAGARGGHEHRCRPHGNLRARFRPPAAGISDFVQRLPFYGTAVLCVDDPNVREIMPAVTKPVTTYGLSRGRARCAPSTSSPTAGACIFACCAPMRADKRPDLDITLNLAGAHNVLNALAAIAVGMEVGVARRGDCSARWPISKASAGAFSAMAKLPWSKGGRVHADRRLRPSPGRNGGDAGGRARRFSGTPPRARVPAAPLYAHARLLRGFRARAVAPLTRCC